MSRKKPPPPRKKKIGPPGSFIPKLMYTEDPIWPTLSRFAYRSKEEIALASGAPPYPYKLSGRAAPQAKLGNYRMTKSAKRTKGGPNASD